MITVKSLTIEVDVKERLARLKRDLSLQLGKRCNYKDVIRYLLDLAGDEARWQDTQR